MRVAGSEFGPGIADADDRPSVEYVLRHALVFHPGSIDEAHFIGSPEPLLAAEGGCWKFAVHGKYSNAQARRDECNRRLVGR